MTWEKSGAMIWEKSGAMIWEKSGAMIWEKSGAPRIASGKKKGGCLFCKHK